MAMAKRIVCLQFDGPVSDTPEMQAVGIKMWSPKQGILATCRLLQSIGHSVYLLADASAPYYLVLQHWLDYWGFEGVRVVSDLPVGAFFVDNSYALAGLQAVDVTKILDDVGESR